MDKEGSPVGVGSHTCQSETKAGKGGRYAELLRAKTFGTMRMMMFPEFLRREWQKGTSVSVEAELMGLSVFASISTLFLLVVGEIVNRRTSWPSILFEVSLSRRSEWTLFAVRDGVKALGFDIVAASQRRALSVVDS